MRSVGLNGEGIANHPPDANKARTKIFSKIQSCGYSQTARDDIWKALETNPAVMKLRSDYDRKIELVHEAELLDSKVTKSIQDAEVQLRFAERTTPDDLATINSLKTMCVYMV